MNGPYKRASAPFTPAPARWSRTAQVACALLVVGLLMGATGLTVVMFERIDGVRQLTGDSTTVAGVPWWTGAVARLTNLCWAVAATANVLAARGATPSLQRPLLVLGLLCVALALDDTMLLHEAALPGFGVPQELILGCYAVVGLVLGWWWLRAAGDVWVRGAFFAGAVMLAASLVTDAIFHGLLGFGDTSALLLVEEGAKLTGVLAWCFCGAWAHRGGAASGVRLGGSGT